MSSGRVVAGESEDALADDVALDLVGPAADRREVGVQGEEVGVVGARVLGAGEQRLGAEDVGLHGGAGVEDARHRQLQFAACGRRWSALVPLSATQYDNGVR